MTLSEFSAKGAAARWKGVTKKERSKLMSAAAKKSHLNRKKKK